jgi:hypothetical protein
MKLATAGRVRTTMKTLLLVLAIAACGGKQTPAPSNGSAGSGSAPVEVKDDRTELQKRLATACEAVGTKVTECAVEDAKAMLADGKITQKVYDESTTFDVRKKNTEEFVKKCDVPTMSSRQVRVLEVCHKEEQQCGPFLDCLSHLADNPVTSRPLR